MLNCFKCLKASNRDYVLPDRIICLDREICTTNSSLFTLLLGRMLTERDRTILVFALLLGNLVTPGDMGVMGDRQAATESDSCRDRNLLRVDSTVSVYGR